MENCAVCETENELRDCFPDVIVCKTCLKAFVKCVRKKSYVNFVCTREGDEHPW